MNKKMRELLAKIEGKTNEAKALMEGDGKDLNKAIATFDEADSLKVEFEAEKRLFEAEKSVILVPEEKQEEDPAEKGEDIPEAQKDSTKEFANAARRGFVVAKDMSEGSNDDGGYAVPEDIQTQINEYREAKFSLRDLVDVEPVTTEKGQRTYKKRAQQSGFALVGEGGKISKKATPQFERMDYAVKKYGGYFPVTNELLADSDQNITQVLTQWIGDESRIAGNKLILDQINTKTKVDLKDLDGIKKALNVTLGAAFKGTSSIITNDDGLQYLDTLKDETGRYLLAPNPADTLQMRLSVGGSTIPVNVIGNADLPSDNGRVPIIVGDLKEGVKFFDRQKVNIKSSDIAVMGDLNAFEEDLTLFRAIEREDVKVKDQAAFVNGYIEV